MTPLLVSIVAADAESARSDIARALEGGADGVELRLDRMPDATDEQVIQLCAEVPEDRIVALTIRSRTEGGAYDGDEMHRVSRLIELGPHAQWIDCEASAWFASANIRQKIMLALRRARHAETNGPHETIDHPGKRTLVLSRHEMRGRPATLSAELVRMIDESAADIVKIAWLGRTVRDNFEALDLLRDTPARLIAVVLGESGLASRVLCRKFGAAGAFAALDDGGRAAPGQLTLRELKSLYRWDAIGPNTAVYGLVGDPVAHSLSPAVHNAAMAALGIDAVYVPFRVAAGYESFKAFMVEALARPWLDLRGLSVTAPHKQNALRFMRERGSAINPSATRIGAVNTICLSPDGSLRATNTDAPAVIAALCDAMHIDAGGLRGKRAVVLGAGGAARAAIAALHDAGAQVHVIARNAPAAEDLAHEFGCEAQSWDRRSDADAEIWINATPLGQSPDDTVSALPATCLKTGCVVLDMVYRPTPTRLLRETRAAGGIAVDGLSVFLLQAAAQFNRWHGAAPPPAAMLDAVRRRMQPA